MRISLFWRSAVAVMALLIAAMAGMDVYSSRVLHAQALNAAFTQLSALARVAQARPPQVTDSEEMNNWVKGMAASGARVTVLRSDGRVLAESERDPEGMENHANRPEFIQAMADGQGRSVRHSKTLDRDLVYLAVRYPAPPQSPPSVVPLSPGLAHPLILRFALPLTEVNEASAAVRRRIWLAFLLIVLIAGAASALVSRGISRRIADLKEFTRRVAGGDFRPLTMRPGGGELDDLGAALNETAMRLDRTIRTLTGERNRSAAILSSMIEGVAVISAQERVLFSNRAFSQILGLNGSPIDGRPLLEVARQSDLLAVVKKALAGDRQVSNEIVVGTVRPKNFAVTAAPVHAGGPTGAVLVLHDITELRRLERVRQDFVANVSHEFRTPLTAIQGFAETLLSGALDDPANRRRFLEIIRDHAGRLARLTGDLLKLARIEAGQLEIEFRPVSVYRLVESCLETARFKAAPAQLSIAVELPDGLPPIRGDASRLQEVLQNLLDNAVQYTPAGGRIDVYASLNGREVVISVADSGIGIPQAEQQRVFERFYRVDVARSREAGGTGLGLSISRHIVEAHGGRIWVESDVGAGSRFHFSIPVAG